MSNIILATPNAVRQTMANHSMQKQLSALLSDVNKRNQMTSSMVAMVQQTPALQQCEVSSLFNASLAGAALDLPYGFGYWYAIPYNNTKLGYKQAQFQIGYKGLIQMALRTGQYRKIVVNEIKEGEDTSINSLTETYEFEALDEKVRDKAKTIGYYAMFELHNGFKKEVYWSKDKVFNHANEYSMAFDITKYDKFIKGKVPEKDLWKYSSFWYKNFDEMAKKTVIKSLLSKWGILSVEMQSIIKKDQSIIDGDKLEYIDNKKDEQEPIVQKDENNVGIESLEAVDSETKVPEYPEIAVDELLPDTSK